MYYWQEEASKTFIPEGDWNSEREKYGSFDGKIKPNIKPKFEPKGKSSYAKKKTKESLDIEMAYGVRKEVVERRIKAGWNKEAALHTPVYPRQRKAGKDYFIGCQRFTLAEFAQHLGVTYAQLHYKFRRDGITQTHWQEVEVAQLVEHWYIREG